jgi:prevent-host-death family protein
MASPGIGKNDGGTQASVVVSAVRARANLSKLLDSLEDEGRSVVIERRGVPKAVLLSLRDYLKLAAPEPEVLQIIGEESKRNGTNGLTSRQINRVIREYRVEKKKR